MARPAIARLALALGMAAVLSVSACSREEALDVAEAAGQALDRTLDGVEAGLDEQGQQLRDGANAAAEATRERIDAADRAVAATLDDVQQQADARIDASEAQARRVRASLDAEADRRAR